jgi:hypothetical protein
MARKPRNRTVLRLIRERKLADLIAAPSGAVLEASGVFARGRSYFVVFDNLRGLARIDRSLEPGGRHEWVGRARSGEGYEDLTYSPHRKRFYLLVEAEKHPDGTYKAIIEELDDVFRFKGRHWVDFPFSKRNTGFEGLTAVRWHGVDFLLALCEGNRCQAGRKGAKGGRGRIHVLQRRGTKWQPVARIKLPRSVKFADYSAVAVRGDRVVVISQEDSRLWIGRLRRGDWTLKNDTRIYDFPRSKKGKRLYCTVEGISWLSANTFVVVSDLTKKAQPRRGRRKDQSIHIFKLPRAAASRK